MGTLDTTRYYGLTNQSLGANQSLDTPDDSGRLMMAPTGNLGGQMWKLVPRGGEKYWLRTAYMGDPFSLDVTNETAWLKATGYTPGQSWTLTSLDETSYKLTNDSLGSDKSLAASSANSPLSLSTGDDSAHRWTLTDLGKIPGNVAIPELNLKGQTVSLTLGSTNYDDFTKRPTGTVKAVMVFVDFTDATAPTGADGQTLAKNTAMHLLGNGQARAQFCTQSYGQLTLEVDVKSDLGWKRMPKAWGDYQAQGGNWYKTYIADAVSLFQPPDVTFNPADKFVFIVSAPDADVTPSRHCWRGIGSVVTFGKGAYKDTDQCPYSVLIHEVGHVFGLPDLYPAGGVERNLPSEYTSKGVIHAVGSWSVMADMRHSESFLGWERHKMGWLSEERKAYLPQNLSPWYPTLSPLSGDCGVSMVVLPIDDYSNPSKVLVAELAQPVIGSDGSRLEGNGVLLYTVDATLSSGSFPIKIIPKQISKSDVYGELYEAPFTVGDRKEYKDGPLSITVEVLHQRVGPSYNLKIDIWRAAPQT